MLKRLLMVFTALLVALLLERRDVAQEPTDQATPEFIQRRNQRTQAIHEYLDQQDFGKLELEGTL